MATTCSVNWASGCGAVTGFFNKMMCWLGCRGTLFLLILAIVSFVLFVLWILTLVHQAKRKRWGWFVLTLLFYTVQWIYWFVWLVSKDFRRKK